MAWTYQYRCPDCGRQAEHSSDEAFCTCGANMERERIVWHGAVRPNNFAPYWHVGLGCMVHTPNDVKNRIKELNGEQGMKLEELGTEDPAKLKKPRLNDDAAVTDAAGEWVAAVKEAGRA